LFALECVESGHMSAAHGRGWGAYRLDIPGEVVLHPLTGISSMVLCISAVG